MKSIFLKIIKIKQSLQNAFPRKLKQYRDIFANEMCLKIFTRVASRQLQKKKKKIVIIDSKDCLQKLFDFSLHCGL